MARTTTDPKGNTVAMRLNDADLVLLDGLAERWTCSRTDVLRRLVRGEQSIEQDLETGQRVIAHLPELTTGLPGVILGFGYKCLLRFDKPWRRRGDVIEELERTFRDPYRIGDRVNDSRHPGRVTKCEPVYSVLLDGRGNVDARGIIDDAAIGACAGTECAGPHGHFSMWLPRGALEAVGPAPKAEKRQRIP